MIARRQFGACLGGLLLSRFASASQSVERIYRVGHLMFMPREPLTPLIAALVEGLRDLGYIEGRNVVIEHRSANGQLQQLPEVAVELVRLKVDVIVTGVNQGIVAAKQATNDIPIVMVHGVDPVGMGFISNLRRPGGNITGGTWGFPEPYGKNVELFRELMPTRSSRARSLRTCRWSNRGDSSWLSI